MMCKRIRFFLNIRYLFTGTPVDPLIDRKTEDHFYCILGFGIPIYFALYYSNLDLAIGLSVIAVLVAGYIYYKKETSALIAHSSCLNILHSERQRLRNAISFEIEARRDYVYFFVYYCYDLADCFSTLIKWCQWLDTSDFEIISDKSMFFESIERYRIPISASTTDCVEAIKLVGEHSAAIIMVDCENFRVYGISGHRDDILNQNEFHS